jgi:hypothetical protein
MRGWRFCCIYCRKIQFLFSSSERIGWIPQKDEVPDAVTSEYSWITGLSVTEMEIMHGAYRNDNPNGELVIYIGFSINVMPPCSH